MIKKALYYFKKKIAKKNRNFKCNYEHDNITIISCNCIGGLVYSDLGMKFFSPTINLFIKSPDFVKFANNLKYYLSQELTFVSEKEYPIGRIDDIYIHFLHYKSFYEAKLKWDERKSRVLWDKIFIIMSDRDDFSVELIPSFLKIPYPKILYSHVNYPFNECVWVKKDAKRKEVNDLTKYATLSGIKNYEYYFDIEKWITGKFNVSECKINR